MKKTRALLLSVILSLGMIIPSVKSSAADLTSTTAATERGTVSENNEDTADTSEEAEKAPSGDEENSLVTPFAAGDEVTEGEEPTATTSAEKKDEETGLPVDEKSENKKDASAIAAEDSETIAVVAINDFHGSLLEEKTGKNPGIAKVAGAIDELKDEYSSVHFVSAGDQYQGSAISNLTKGESVNEALKAMGMEASAIGNHEYDWGVEMMEKWAKEGGFKFLASNIEYTATGKPVEYADPYMVKEYTLTNGTKVKIGYIGIATPETKDKTLAENVKDITFTDPATAANKWAKYLQEQEMVNAVIALTHLGGFQDKDTREITGEVSDFAKNVKGVDLIFSGHAHQTIDGLVNGIQVLQGYYNGRTLSIGELKFDKNTGKLLGVDGKVDEIYLRKDKITPDPEVSAIASEYEEKLSPILNEVIGKDEKGLEHSREQDVQVTPLGAWASERLAELGGTQIGYINGGGIRTSINPGEITMGNMYEIFPFDNTLVTMDLSGADLLKVLQHGITHDGFSSGQYYGVKVTLDDNNMIKTAALLDGTPIENDKYYSVSTLDFLLTGGDKYDFSGGKNVTDTFRPVRDLLAEYIKENKGLFAAGTTVPDPSTKPETTKPENTKPQPESSAPKTSFINVAHYFTTLKEAMEAYPGSFPMAENGYFVVYTDRAPLTEYVFDSLADAADSFPGLKPLADGGKYYIWSEQFPLTKYTYETQEEFYLHFPNLKPLYDNGKFSVWTTGKPLMEYVFDSYKDAMKAFPGANPLADKGKFHVWTTFEPAQAKPVITGSESTVPGTKPGSTVPSSTKPGSEDPSCTKPSAPEQDEKPAPQKEVSGEVAMVKSSPALPSTGNAVSSAVPAAGSLITLAGTAFYVLKSRKRA